MSSWTLLFSVRSDTWQLNTFPLFQSLGDTCSWRLTTTWPSDLRLMEAFDPPEIFWAPENHSMWGLNPTAVHESVCAADSSLGAKRSFTEGSTEMTQQFAHLSLCGVNKSCVLTRGGSYQRGFLWGWRWRSGRSPGSLCSWSVCLCPGDVSGQKTLCWLSGAQSCLWAE